MSLDLFINTFTVLALLTLVVLVAIGVVDLSRECWRPEPHEDTPGFRVLPNPPYDFESEAP